MRATCQSLTHDALFTFIVNGSDDFKDELWSFYEKYWHAKVYATIKYDDIDSHGKPLSPLLISISK